MKFTKLWVMTLLLVGLRFYGQTSAHPAATESQAASAGYSITVVPPPDPIRLGSPINVSITAKDISNKELPWRSEFADTASQAFHVLLTHNGEELEKTAFHRRVRSEQRPGDPAAVESSSSIVTLTQPGKSCTFTIDLTRFYQITEPGLYTLNVSRFDEFSKRMVSAKPLTLKIG